MTDRDVAPGTAAPMLASKGRRAAIGCFTFFLGAMSGGMVAVLVSKLVALMTRAPSCPGIPTCDWYLYWIGGAVLGGVTLPVLVLRAMSRLKQPN